MLPGFYIGEFMYGSEWAQEEGRKGKLYLFDVIEIMSVSLQSEPYFARYARLEQQRNLLPPHWHIVSNYPTTSAAAIWDNLVATQKFEGLVFRNPADPWDVRLLRAKLELTIDLTVMGFQRGNGKHSESLGALLATDSNGIEHTVGGGLTDKLRREIWADKSAFIGRVFVCKFKKTFRSGQLRHPNFAGWHLEKGGF